MGRFVAQADVLPDQLVLAAAVELPGADTTDRVGVGRAVLVGGIEAPALLVQHKPGRVVAGERLQRLRVDPAFRRIEAQAQNARAVAVVRVAADQDVHVVGLGSRAGRQRRADQHSESEAKQYGAFARGH